MHLASLAGAWIALVEGFAGMREYGGQLSFNPVLPPGITELSFHLRWQGTLLHVCVTPSEVTYTADGGGIRLDRAGGGVRVAADRKGGAVLHGPRSFGPPTWHHQPVVYSGIGEAEAAAQLRAFFAERRQ